VRRGLSTGGTGRDNHFPAVLAWVEHRGEMGAHFTFFNTSSVLPLPSLLENSVRRSLPGAAQHPLKVSSFISKIPRIVLPLFLPSVMVASMVIGFLSLSILDVPLTTTSSPFFRVNVSPSTYSVMSLRSSLGVSLPSTIRDSYFQVLFS